MFQSTTVVILAAAVAMQFVLPANAQQSRVVVSAEDCKRLVRHSPSSDAEYKPGVDVRGKAVAPADLPGTNTLKLPESFEFDITLQVFERLGIAVPQGLNETQLTVGKVSVGKNGVITFNGEPVDGSEEAAIAAACQEMLQQLRR